MGEIEFKSRKIPVKPMRWATYMDILQLRKTAIETNDELLMNQGVEKSLLEITGLTREDIKDWAIEEVYACLAKIRDASTIPLQPNKK